MSKHYSYCGYDCSNCPIFKFSKMNDNDKNHLYNKLKEYNKKLDIEIDKLRCEGCKSEDNIFIFCEKCSIRQCAMNKGVENCGQCDEYSNCEIIEDVKQKNKKSKEYLDSFANK